MAETVASKILLLRLVRMRSYTGYDSKKMKQKITYDQSIFRVPYRLQTTKPGSYCLLFPQGRAQCQVEHTITYGGLKSNMGTGDGNNDQFMLLIQCLPIRSASYLTSSLPP